MPIKSKALTWFSHRRCRRHLRRAPPCDTASLPCGRCLPTAERPEPSVWQSGLINSWTSRADFDFIVMKTPRLTLVSVPCHRYSPQPHAHPLVSLTHRVESPKHLNQL